ncbi:MAG: fibronectin type III domain-containing protein [Bacteroidota bacterium]
MKKRDRHTTNVLRVFAALTGLVLFVQSQLDAQTLARYTATRTTGITFTGINTTGNSFPSWRNSAGGNYNEDDNRSYPVDIGFDFWYNGVRYTQFSVSTNGFIDFSSSTDDGGPLTHQYGPYDDDMSEDAPTEITTLVVAPFYLDLTTYGATDPLGESIHYDVSGTTGNRVLTVEWYKVEPWVAGGGGNPDFTFQVKLYESSGVIEFVYGAMNMNGFVFANQTVNVAKGYTSGMNGATMSAAPTAAELYLQQSPNSTTFNNLNATGGELNPPHTLQTEPSSNSKITISPPAMNAPHTLSFTSVTQTSMTLNWVDTLWNEVGFVIYRSDDGGANYNFITQTAPNVTSYNMTGLLAGTTYYYRVYAVNEGRLSSALSGNQFTASPGAPTTVASGSWKNPLTWSTAAVPGISDNATIADGHTVYIDTTVTVNSITVGQGTSGTLLIGDDNTARSITVIGNIDVKAGAIFRVNGTSNTSGHTITAAGNILNAGRFSMATDADSRCAVVFNKSGTQTISGSGDSTHFYTITLNMGSSRSNVLDVFATNFTVSGTNFLTITNGTFNLATGANVTPFTTDVSIPLSGGIRVNHASAILNTTGGNITVQGEFKVQNGTVNIGNNVDQNLISRGGIFDFSGGTTKVRGRFEPYSAFDITDFTMSAGTLIVADSGSTSTTNSPFTMNVAGSRFTMSGGTIIVKKEGGGGAADLGFVNTGYSNYTVTGGTVQIGQTGLTPSGQTMRINSSIPLFDLVVNSSNATATLITNNLTVLNDVTITLGTLNANGLDMTVARNWTNNSQTFTAGSGKVTFNGTSSQSITDAAGETFNKLTINKSSGTLTLANNTTVNDSFQLSAGTLDVGTTTLTLNGIVAGGGTLLSSSNGTVNYNRSAAGQTVLTANYGNLTFSNFTKVLPSAIIGISGTFTPGNAAGHTITGNTIDFNSSGVQNISSFTYNNLTTSNGGTKTIQPGADTVLGTLTIGTGTTIADNGIGLRVFGSVVHNGSHSGTGSIILNGSSSQTISGTGSYQNLTINNANGVVLSGGKTINGVLTFTTGVITTGTDTLTIASGGSVSRTSGHVYGWLKKNLSTGSNVAVTFEVGDAAAANYTPAAFTFASVTSAGNLSTTTVNTEHPDINSTYIDPTNNVNRYWQTINSGGVAFTTYDVTFTFLNPGDLDATGTETSFRMNFNNGSVWDSTTAGTRTTTTNQATGIAQLGTYVVGLQVTSGAYRSAQTGNWNVTSTWERFNGVSWVAATATPSSTDGLITIRSGHTVSVTANVSIDQTVIDAGGIVSITGTTILTVANGGGTDLAVNGTLQSSSSNNITTTGTIVVNSGGKYIHNRNGGNIPIATWDVNSTCEITGVTNTLPGNRNQTFGNFTWNCAGQSAALQLALQPASVTGNYSIISTGSSNIRILNNTTTALTIGGDLIIQGGTVLGKNAGNNTQQINVTGNYTQSGGSFTMSAGANDNATMNVSGSVSISAGTFTFSSAAATDIINVSGDFLHTGGTITETSTGTASVVFNGTLVQNFSDGGTISNTINFTVNSGAILSLGTSAISGAGTFTLSSGGTLKMGSTAGITTTGATGNVQVTGTRTYSTGANYTYNGSSAQVTGNGLPATANKLEINNSAGVTLTASVAVTDSLNLLAGTLAIGSNTLTINNVAHLVSGSLSSAANGTVNYNKSSNGQTVLSMNYGNLTFSNFNKTLPSGTVGIAGSFTPGTATGHTTTGNTIDFNGSGTQNVGAWSYYNNLTVSGTNWKKLTGNTIVNGNLSVSNGTLSDSIYTLTVKGNITNNSVITGTNNFGKTILTSGTTAHSLSGTGSYWILELDDSYGAITSSNFSIDSLIYLTSGILTTGSNTVICNSLPGVYRSVTGGHINGRLRKNISASGVPENYTFEVGDAVNYTPIELTFQSVSVAGTVTAFQTASDHSLVKYSGLDQNKSVNRYYTLSGSGLTFTTYDATFNFISSDIDAGANTAYFFVKRYESPSWYPSTVNVRQSTSTRTLGITAFGEFAVGEASSVFYWTQGAGTYNWGDDYNWSSHSVPTAGNTVYFDMDDTVEVNVNGICKDLIIQNDTMRLTILAGKTLTVNGNLYQYSGEFSTRNGFPTVTGSVSLSGGLFGYDSSGGTQTVSLQTYYNLRVSGGGTKTAAGGFTVNKNLTIGSGATFADGGFTVTVKDSITNNGAHIGSGKILLDGTTQHQLTGSGSFTNLQLNNSSNGITLDSNLTINGTLTLSNGIITAPNDTLFISSTGDIVRTSGHINGNLRKYFAPASDSLSFEIGTASSYLPVTVSFGTITSGGNLTMRMISGDHFDITNSTVDPDSSVNRYWIADNNGIVYDSYNLTVNWLSGDVDAGISDFSDFIMAIRSSSGVWDELTAGAVTSTSFRGMSGTYFGSFAVGKPSSGTFTSVATGNWSAAATWDVNKVPKRRDKVIIASPHVVTLTADSKIGKLTINAGGELADAGYTLDLYGNFIFNGTWSGSGRIRWNDNIGDTLSGTGGKTSGTSTLFVNGTGKLITATNDTLYRIQIAPAKSITNNGIIRTTRLIGDDASATWVNAAGSTLNVGDTLLTTGTLTATSSNNTVIYNGTIAQSVKATDYFSLTLSGARGANSVTLPASAITIAGTFSPTASFTSGGYVVTGNTIDFSNTTAQSIPAFGYNNLTISGSRGANSITLVNGDTIKIAGIFSPAATFTSGGYVKSGNWIAFNGNGAQTIPAFQYNSLKISGGRTTNNVTFAGTDTIGVADSLSFQASFSTGGYVTTGSTIAYNGTGTQTISPFNYYNLSISGARTTNNVVFCPTGTIGIAGVLAHSASFTSGGLAFTNSSIDFNGTGSQTIPAFNYHNLTISGTRTTNNVTLAPSTIGISGIFSPSATFAGGEYVVTSNTFSFNGSGAQSIPAFTYNNLQTGTGGTKTAAGSLRVYGNLTIGASTTFDASSTTDTVYGDWTNNGTFIASTSQIILAGAPAATISGTTTFNDLVVNKLDSATAISVASNIQVANLTMTMGTMQTGSNEVTITSTRSGNGIIIGTVTRTHAFALSTPYAFEGPNTLLTFTAGTTPSSVSITVTQTTPSSPTMVVVDRSFNIALSGGSGLTSTLRLHYENSEANELNETIMNLWRYTSSWQNQSATTRDSVNNYIELSGISSITGNWAIGSSASSKTISDINGGVANAGDSLLVTIDVTNPYRSTKNNIVVSDPLDNNFILKAGTISNAGNISGQSVNANGSLVGGTVQWPAFSLVSGASTSRTFKVFPDSLTGVPTELIANTASINFGGTNIEYVSASITITNIANITIDTNIVSNQTPIPGDTLIYTLKYSNVGTSNATSVVLTYTIPGNTTFLTNGYGAGTGIELNGVAKTNAADADEVSVSGSNITVTLSSLTPGTQKQVKFKTVVN